MVRNLSCANELKSVTGQMFKSHHRIWLLILPFGNYMSLKVIFNVHTLMRIEQQIDLAMSLQSLNIDVCCLFETRIQKVPQNHLLSVESERLFCVRLTGDPVASWSGLAGGRVGIALSARVEVVITDWISITSRACPVTLEGFTKVRQNRCENNFLLSLPTLRQIAAQMRLSINSATN